MDHVRSRKGCICPSPALTVPTAAHRGWIPASAGMTRGGSCLPRGHPCNVRECAQTATLSQFGQAQDLPLQFRLAHHTALVALDPCTRFS